MVKDQTYHGVIITDEPASEGSLVFLSSGNDAAIAVPDSTTIQPYGNHGIFQITPKGEGEAVIFATYGGNLYQASTQVFSSTSEPASLTVILPANKTKTDSMLAYVVVNDDHGSPAVVRKNLSILLSTSEPIDAPRQVTIRNGTATARFEMDVGGSGHITASADALRPGRVDITKVQNEFTVRMAVAPGIAMPDSYAFYYIWLEKDGMPYRPPHVVDAFIHSGDQNVARFAPHPELESDGALVHLVDGVARGILYTGERGYGTITASIPEIGSAHDVLFVGHARIGGTEDGDPTVLLYEQNISEKYHTDHTPNTIFAWIYPSVTDGQAWGVAATYYTNHTESLETTFESDMMENHLTQNTLIVPAEAEGLLYVSSSQGLEHEGAYGFEERLTKTNAVEFEISGTHGNYTVTVSAGGLESADAAINIMERYAGSFRLEISPIPALPHVKQDIAMVSILDETGSMVDAKEIFGNTAKFLISTDIKTTTRTPSPLHSGSAIIEGVLSDSGEITAIMDGVESDHTDILPAGIATSVELLIPDVVHTGERFPFAVHEIDSLGIPIRMAADWKISSPLGISSLDGFMTVREPGSAQTSIISPKGADEQNLSGFENTMNVELFLEKKNYRVGEKMTLDIQNSVDATYDLITDYTYELTDSDTFTIHLDSEDESSVITLIATRDGFSPVSISETISVQNILAMDVRVTDSHGTRIAMPFDVTIDGESTLVTPPYHAEFRPGAVRIVFPEQGMIYGQGYSFEAMRVNDHTLQDNILSVTPERDLTITAVYGVEILVSVVNGEGSGVYRQGDTVVVSAPDREKFSFLIRDVFDHWEGIDATVSEVTFTAHTDVVITAVYREDYTYLMVVTMIPLLGVGVFTVFRNTSGIRWMMENCLERLVRFGRSGKASGVIRKNPTLPDADNTGDVSENGTENKNTTD